MDICYKYMCNFYMYTHYVSVFNIIYRLLCIRILLECERNEEYFI